MGASCGFVKWLNLGLPLMDVVTACTFSPAKIHKLPWGIGTLKSGANGNVTIFSVEDRPFHLKNRMEKSLMVKK